MPIRARRGLQAGPKTKLEASGWVARVEIQIAIARPHGWWSTGTRQRHYYIGGRVGLTKRYCRWQKASGRWAGSRCARQGDGQSRQRGSGLILVCPKVPELVAANAER